MKTKIDYSKAIDDVIKELYTIMDSGDTVKTDKLGPSIEQLNLISEGLFYDSVSKR